MALPLDEDGVYCTVGGRTFEESLLEAAKGAAAIIEYGSYCFLGRYTGGKTKSNKYSFCIFRCIW